MRALLVGVQANFWSEISAVVFALLFIALTIWVFLPARKSEYKRASQMPLED